MRRQPSTSVEVQDVVLLLAADRTLVPTQVRAVDRVRARVSAHSLDDALARGAHPDSTVPLALRARRLVSSSHVATLRRALGRIAAGDDRAPRRASMRHVPPSTRPPSAVEGAMVELVTALSTAPLPDVRTLARITVLVTDAGSPLYRGPRRERLDCVRGLVASVRADPVA